MVLNKNLLFASGDIGGARAIIPIMKNCIKKNHKFFFVPNGHILKEAESSWDKASISNDTSEDKIAHFLSISNIGCLIFASSVKDDLALRVASLCGKLGIPTVHILDNWTSYRERLVLDNGELCLPDVYAVMDELAYHDAINAGIDSKMLLITGHPALNSLNQDLSLARKSLSREDRLMNLGLPIDKKVILFISEPVEKDNGHNRGYTEKTSLEILCRCCQSESTKIQVLVLPHPREDRGAVEISWSMYRGKLDGAVVGFDKGRSALCLADGVAGMASLLLYEAWLVGVPVASIQPNLKLAPLEMLSKRDGVQFIDSYDKVKLLSYFFDKVKNPSILKRSNEFYKHTESTDKIMRIIESLVNKGIVRREVVL